MQYAGAETEPLSRAHAHYYCCLGGIIIRIINERETVVPRVSSRGNPKTNTYSSKVSCYAEVGRP